MSTFSVKINPEGLKDFGLWAKTTLMDKEQDELAKILDETFEFEGIAGELFELIDGKLFKTIIKKGIESIL